MSLQVLRAAKMKSVFSTSVPLVCLGFCVGYVCTRMNSSHKRMHMLAEELTQKKSAALSIANARTEIDNLVRDALAAIANKIDESSISDSNWFNYLTTLLEIDELQDLLIKITKFDVFGDNFARVVSYNVSLLSNLKRLKYWYNFNCNQFFITLHDLSVSMAVKHVAVDGDSQLDSCHCGNCGELGVASLISAKLSDLCLQDCAKNSKKLPKMRDIITTAKNEKFLAYKEDIIKLEYIDAHSIYPTSIYRRSNGLCLSNKDESLIECVMSTTITTSIIIENNKKNGSILSLKNKRLSNIYSSFGRCVIILDERVNNLYKQELNEYFDYYGIDVVKLAFSGNECDKHIKSVENILTLLKKNSVQRNEPVLIIGGGVISDLGGFATALYHRNTPYIMLCTSIVSGIDAGPSPRTCCDGFGYKNIYGCYHAPILTITDRIFFKTLKYGWIRHGIAEIIKMAVVKDIKLFELLEKATTKLIYTKFGTSTSTSTSDDELDDICNEIIKKAMKKYVESEYGNLWETHQCRPHAYGHTWSPGFELPSGMLHGHAVACGMGFGAYLSFKYNFINFKQLIRILLLINNFELSLWHDAMNNWQLIWNAQQRMIEKRGGNLCAPVPKDKIGKCGYINNLNKNNLIKYLNEYKLLVSNSNENVNINVKFARNGYGVDPHCTDVGLENPNKVETMACKYEKEIETLKLQNQKLKKQLQID